MRTMTVLFSAFILLSSFVRVTEGEKTRTISFITSAVCGECKERIEEKLNYTKGVIFAELNLENKMLTVKYKTAVITEQQIKEVLAGIGYSSDTVQRNNDAFLALPKCCQGTETCTPGK